MNKEEIKNWINSAECIDYNSYTENDNLYETRVYRKDNKLYVLHFCNETVSSKWTGKGFQLGVYEPVEVTVEKISRTITEDKYTYKNLKGNKILNTRYYDEIKPDTFPMGTYNN
jgi:hypothetical protein